MKYPLVPFVVCIGILAFSVCWFTSVQIDKKAVQTAAEPMNDQEILQRYLLRPVLNDIKGVSLSPSGQALIYQLAMASGPKNHYIIWTNKVSDLWVAAAARPTGKKNKMQLIVWANADPKELIVGSFVGSIATAETLIDVRSEVPPISSSLNSARSN